MNQPNLSSEYFLLITGRLAEPLVQEIVKPLSDKYGFKYQVHQLNVQVAALLHVEILLNRLKVPENVTKVILPGWVQGDITRLEEKFGLPFILGPKNIVDLPTFLGAGENPPDLTEKSIEIIAEINHAPRMELLDLLNLAIDYQSQGADVIDLGCIPGECWSHVADAVKQLRDHNLRISIDSFERREVEAAVGAGAELVLSCNSTNREWCLELDAECVIIPDQLQEWQRMEETFSCFEKLGKTFRIDPVLEPIGFGFGASLLRYASAHERWPDLRQMVGIGNVTELTQVDSSGVNMLLVALTQEWGGNSILTTQVAPWTRHTIRELEIARRLVHHSLKYKRLPKRLGEHLVQLSGVERQAYGSEYIERMASQIKDPNFRIIAEKGILHLMNRTGHFSGTNPFEVFEEALKHNELTAEHAFYLGYEMSKAVTALTVGKPFRQDQALNWGFLTQEESPHHP